VFEDKIYNNVARREVSEEEKSDNSPMASPVALDEDSMFNRGNY
jgi:hypothetical protein